MTDRYRRVLLRGAGAAAIALLALSLAGCSQGFDVGAFNRCGKPVEVDISESSYGADQAPAWTALDTGERNGVRLIAEDHKSVYVIVRRPDTNTEETATIPVPELDEPPAAADYDKEVVLTGRLCPR